MEWPLFYSSEKTYITTIHLSNCRNPIPASETLELLLKEPLPCRSLLMSRLQKLRLWPSNCLLCVREVEQTKSSRTNPCHSRSCGRSLIGFTDNRKSQWNFFQTGGDHSARHDAELRRDQNFELNRRVKQRGAAANLKSL